MAHPKRRISKARKNKRRTHLKVEGVNLTTCTNCGEVHQMHTACGACGYYRGRQVINIKA